MDLLTDIGHALASAGTMAWEVLWALVLGFALSAVVQAVVHRDAVTGLLGGSRPRDLAVASGLGAASSSCSYAAVALARSLFRKGASFTSAIVFEIASTNLVLELGIILVLLLGWQFAVAEYVGGVVMIVVVALLLRALLRPHLVDEAKQQADKAIAGSMEGHAAMDMSVSGGGSWWSRLRTSAGFTSVSHVFVMEWAAVLRDVAIGLLIAGAVEAWVPDGFWRAFFLSGHPFWAEVEGPVVGPVVAVLSFVCSVGNVPLAGVLWNGGISFGGVVSFVFADLLIVPVLLIYRKYYGLRTTLLLTGVLYAASVVAGYVVELLFWAAHLVPAARDARVEHRGISWDYTTFLDIAFLALAALLVWRFTRTGGREMLAMMGGGPDDMAGHDHHDQHDGGDHREHDPAHRAHQHEGHG